MDYKLVNAKDKKILLVCEKCEEKYGTRIEQLFNLANAAGKKRFLEFTRVHNHGSFAEMEEADAQEAKTQEIAFQVWREFPDLPTKEKMLVLKARLDEFWKDEKGELWNSQKI